MLQRLLFGLGAAMLASANDPSAGKAIFEGKGGCIRCHSVGERGGSLGPELGEAGVLRSPESLQLAITDPNVEIYREFFTVIVETSQGQRVEGIALNEDDLSIQLRDAEGNPRSFLKENLKELRREERSLMPSYKSKLSAAEIGNLVAYLRTLKRHSRSRPGRSAHRCSAHRCSANQGDRPRQREHRLVDPSRPGRR